MDSSKIKGHENFCCAPLFLRDNSSKVQIIFYRKLQIFFTAPLHTRQDEIYLSSFLVILVCLNSRYSFVEIKPELQKNISKFGYGINYKYQGMLAHYFDRFYVITKFILPTLDDLKLSPIGYDKECSYI